MSNHLTTTNKPFSLVPQTMTEAMHLAKLLSESTMVPRDYQGKPGNVLVAMQWGAEIGLAPLQAIQNIAVINGRPSIWGDAALALVWASGLLEEIDEHQSDVEAFCVVKRKGQAAMTRTFSVEDAKAAGLWGKQGPWKQYPKRMMQMRARAFALRDVFPDVLRGVRMGEEERDVLIASNRVSDLPAAPDEPLALPPGNPENESPDKAAPEQLSQIEDLALKNNLQGKDFTKWLRDSYQTSWSRLTPALADEVIAGLKSLLEPVGVMPAIDNAALSAQFEQERQQEVGV